jgi:hypothetical protein
MSTQHTSGPWRYLPGDGLEWRTSVQRGTEGGFVVRGTSREREEADAKLIAAAPELLEALIECEYMIDHCLFGCDAENAKAKARAAIAKATGEHHEHG